MKTTVRVDTNTIRNTQSMVLLQITLLVRLSVLVAMHEIALGYTTYI